MLLAEYITYNAATNVATVVSNVDPWLQSIGWDNLYPSLYLLPLPSPIGPAGSFTVLQYSCAAGAVASISPTNQLTQAGRWRDQNAWCPEGCPLVEHRNDGQPLLECSLSAMPADVHAATAA